MHLVILRGTKKGTEGIGKGKGEGKRDPMRANMIDRLEEQCP